MLALKPGAAFLCALILWIKHHGLTTAAAAPVSADWYYADLGETAENGMMPCFLVTLNCLFGLFATYGCGTGV